MSAPACLEAAIIPEALQDRLSSRAHEKTIFFEYIPKSTYAFVERIMNIGGGDVRDPASGPVRIRHRGA